MAEIASSGTPRNDGDSAISATVISFRLLTARLRAVFNRWFWLNYAVCLLVTAPIPFTTITVNGEFVRRVAIWENYRSLLQGRFTAWPVGAVAAHLGVCFAMCFLVWLVLARPPAPAEPEVEDDNERD